MHQGVVALVKMERFEVDDHVVVECHVAITVDVVAPLDQLIFVALGIHIDGDAHFTDQ